uniref:Putative secreted protein n=1 Tax=Amblyomma triste TaxID=251400 RepID=A0A023G424_AMBTT
MLGLCVQHVLFFLLLAFCWILKCSWTKCAALCTTLEVHRDALSGALSLSWSIRLVEKKIFCLSHAISCLLADIIKPQNVRGLLNFHKIFDRVSCWDSGRDTL